MPTIAFIQPRFENEAIDRNTKTLYPLGLAYLAAHVPEHWESRIIDEQVENVDYRSSFDPELYLLL